MTEKEKVIETVCEIVRDKLAMEGEPIVEALLREELGADEGDISEILCAVGDEYEVDFEPNSDEKFTDINDIINHVVEALQL